MMDVVQFVYSNMLVFHHRIIVKRMNKEDELCLAYYQGKTSSSRNPQFWVGEKKNFILAIRQSASLFAYVVNFPLRYRDVAALLTAWLGSFFSFNDYQKNSVIYQSTIFFVSFHRLVLS